MMPSSMRARRRLAVLASEESIPSGDQYERADREHPKRRLLRPAGGIRRPYIVPCPVVALLALRHCANTPDSRALHVSCGVWQSAKSNLRNIGDGGWI